MMPKTVLFYRDFKQFFGGHLKVWDYYNHVKSDPNYVAAISFSATSVWDETNPWLPDRAAVLPTWRIENADAIFLAGLDWQVLDEQQRQQPSVPVINLIQGVRHAAPNGPQYPFLKYKAIRICVSEEVADALRASGQVNGPIYVVPNGIDQSQLPQVRDTNERDIDLLIVGVKRKPAAKKLMSQLAGDPTAGKTIELLTEKVPRTHFLELLNRAKATVFMPNLTEGFYLPALEAMALGTLVVCPDCIGNRSFCIDEHNCFRPHYTESEVLDSSLAALQLSPTKVKQMLANAGQTADKHDLDAERQGFLQILRNVSQIW